ncbi:alpha/beta fold hydrolase [Sandaracinobacteroides saxicola]|uniref:Alpha/beta fold hydrolase n=1 Tax=Sandaracinobacteroides saxicola TaxID=2759707 RepID=A0A7G5IL27_9SPHN|nr:alpha/beta fold hydrolase [Sandaracinobacteroides saxicola]QMW24069.1 alpha/beta fold hydrolase [Sandaracinobacteroides saxicola]
MNRFVSFDGVSLAWQEMGTGRPLLLLHGLFSSGATNWVRYGTAGVLAEAGYRVILPDFRGHGGSDAPTDPAAWPDDVLAMDIEAFVSHLGLGDFDLGGYSMGARTVARLLLRGMTPRRAILSGMGLGGLTGATARIAWFLRMIEGRGSWPKGTAEWAAEAFMTQNGLNPDAMRLLLPVQLNTPADALARFTLPVGVVCGADDRDNGSAPELAAALPDARYVEIPGNHMSAVARPELATAMLECLRG